MSSSKFCCCCLLVTSFLSSGCFFFPKPQPVEKAQEKLTINPNGSMEFMNRKLPREDVIIYPDGTGGEKAAVKVHDPIHPDFFRDSIRVERITEPVSEVPEKN